MQFVYVNITRIICLRKSIKLLPYFHVLLGKNKEAEQTDDSDPIPIANGNKIIKKT